MSFQNFNFESFLSIVYLTKYTSHESKHTTKYIVIERDMKYKSITPHLTAILEMSYYTLLETDNPPKITKTVFKGSKIH